MEIEKTENPIQVIVNGMSAKADQFIKAVQESSNMEFLSDNYFILSQISMIPPSAIIVDFADFKRNVKHYLDLGIDSVTDIKDFSFIKNDLRQSLGNIANVENIEYVSCEKILEAVMLLYNKEGTSHFLRVK